MFVFFVVFLFILVVFVFFLVVVILVFVSCFSGFDDFLYFHQAFFRAYLTIFDFVDDMADVFEEFNLFRVSFAELYGVDDICNLDDGRLVASGVFQQLVQPGFLKSQSVGEHEVGIGDCGDISCAGLVGVRVHTRRKQA